MADVVSPEPTAREVISQTMERLWAEADAWFLHGLRESGWDADALSLAIPDRHNESQAIADSVLKALADAKFELLSPLPKLT